MENRQQLQRARRRSVGSTFYEVLFVIVIMGVIMSVALPTYTSYREKIRYAEAARDIGIISQRLERFYFTNSRYPEYLVEVGIQDDHELRVDPWGTPYYYLNKTDVDPDTGVPVAGANGAKPDPRTLSNGNGVNTDYDLFSAGADRGYNPGIFTGGNVESSWDDVIRINNGKFIGTPADYNRLDD